MFSNLRYVFESIITRLFFCKQINTMLDPINIFGSLCSHDINEVANFFLFFYFKLFLIAFVFLNFHVICGCPWLQKASPLPSDYFDLSFELFW